MHICVGELVWLVKLTVVRPFVVNPFWTNADLLTYSLTYLLTYLLTLSDTHRNKFQRFFKLWKTSVTLFWHHCVNSLWPSDAIWRQRSGSRLAQVMACCLTAPSHHPNQCWLIIRKVLWYSSEDIMMRRFEDANQQSKLENYIFKITLRSLRGQWVKTTHQNQSHVNIQRPNRCLGGSQSIACKQICHERHRIECTNPPLTIYIRSPSNQQFVNTLRPIQNGRHFTDDIFKGILLNENIWISHKISLKFVPGVRINNIMAWRRSGDAPLSGTMMVSLLTHICVTRPQNRYGTRRVCYNYILVHGYMVVIDSECE